MCANAFFLNRESCILIFIATLYIIPQSWKQQDIGYINYDISYNGLPHYNVKNELVTYVTSGWISQSLS